MKLLKFILIMIYPVLIMLLLLSSFRGCRNSDRSDDGASGQEETEYPEPVDTADVVRRAENIGERGELKVTLLWDFRGDIDLHVMQPNGKEIYFDKKKDDSTGGYLDVDNREGGTGSAENIYWPSVAKGKYTVGLVYYGKARSSGVSEPGTCKVVVFRPGREPETYQVPMTSVGEKKKIIEFEIN